MSFRKECTLNSSLSMNLGIEHSSRNTAIEESVLPIRRSTLNIHKRDSKRGINKNYRTIHTS